MKKLIAALVILVLIIIVGLWFFKRAEAPVGIKGYVKEIATYTSEANGISFTYPTTLKTTEANGIVSVHHEVPFVHHDYCDFKGEGNTTVPIMPDFHLEMHVENLNMVATMKHESPYIPKENFVNNTVVPSPGFIDPVQLGNLKGFSIFEGAEGCGQTTYYLSLTTTRTLVAKYKLVTVFTGAIATEEKAKAEAVPGVINKEKGEAFLNNILSTVATK